MSWAKRWIPIITVGSVLAMVLAACGGDDPTPTPKPATESAAKPAATATPTAPAASAGPAPTATPLPPTATPVPGFDPAAYFSGKTIRIIVGFSPGGGYDAYSRLVGQAVERLMPGNPRVIVSNLPGSGGLRGLQATMRSDPDGLTTHPMANRHPAAEAAGADLDDFDINTVNMVGTPSFSNNHQALCVRRDVATSWEEVLALGRPITTGTSSPGGDMIGGQFAEALGAPVKVIFGYEGTSEVQAAIDRGELDATTRCDVQFIDPLFPEWFEQKKLVPLFYWRDPITQTFLDRMGTGMKSEDVPHVFDVVDSTPEQQTALLLAQNLEAMTRMFVLSPGTPPEIVATWRDVLKQITADAEFLEKAAIAERPVRYGDPQILLDNVDKAKEFTPEARDLFATLYGVKR